VDLTYKELKSKDLKTLMAKMLATVRAPKQDGVGIAAPQVGISKRLICLQRFDKEGGPFECYPNVHIDSLFGAIGKGPEGCLSVPPMRGLVPRYTSVIVSYVDPETLEQKRDTVTGYTAVIFQHECDHLDGILYIDRADTVYVSPSWEAERRAYDYTRPDWWPLLP
jgi:peptide deformylase